MTNQTMLDEQGNVIGGGGVDRSELDTAISVERRAREEAIDAKQHQLDEIRGEVLATDENLTTLATNVSKLNAATTDGFSVVNEEIDRTNKLLWGTYGDSGDIGNLKNRVTTIESKIPAHTSEINQLVTSDALDEAMNTLPAGGLRVPERVEFESTLDGMTFTVDDIGRYFFVQTMDITAEGRTGKAWVNYQDNNPGNPIVLYRTFDHYYSADGLSIVITPAGQLSVGTTWLDGVISTSIAGKSDIGHTHTPDEAGADPVGSADAVQEKLDAFASRTDNPNGVNMLQVGGTLDNFFDNWDFSNPVNQRGGTAYRISSGYTIDRWLISGTGSDLDVDVEEGYLRLSTTITGPQSRGLSQRIENRDRLAGLQLTLSIQYRTSSNNFDAILINSETGATLARLNITPSSTWRIAQLTVTLNTGVSIDSVFIRTIGGTIGTDQSIDVRKIELVPGMVSTLSNRPPMNFPRELAVCQRFYEKSINLNVPLGVPISIADRIMGTVMLRVGESVQSDTHQGTITFKTTKRVAPTVRIYSFIGTPNQVSNANGVDRGEDTGGVVWVGQSGFTLRNRGLTYSSTEPRNPGIILFHWEASADL